jgi:hypothetical protein
MTRTQTADDILERMFFVAARFTVTIIVRRSFGYQPAGRSDRPSRLDAVPA